MNILDGKNKYGVTNSNSIGIEICVNSDGDYAMAVQKSIELTAHLMKLHNIGLDHVIRHYDASRKNCPASMNKNGWEPWRAFKIELERNLNTKVDTNIVKVNIKGKRYSMEGVFQNNKNYVGIRELAETLGFDVGWDQENKVVLIE